MPAVSNSCRKHLHAIAEEIVQLDFLHFAKAAVHPIADSADSKVGRDKLQVLPEIAGTPGDDPQLVFKAREVENSEDQDTEAVLKINARR